MLSMAKSINAAFFGGVLLTLPLAVAGTPRSANPYLAPHASTAYQVKSDIPSVRVRHSSRLTRHQVKSSGNSF